MNDSLTSQFIALLGWTPDEVDRGLIENLNDFPFNLIEEAQKLPSLLRTAFIRHYVSTDNWKFIPVFNKDVIENNEKVKSWRCGRILVPEFAPHALIQLTVDEITKSLAPKDSEKWSQLKPRRDYWEAREYLTGAPAIVDQNLDYKYSPPEYIRDILIDQAEVEKIFDLNVAVRRWIAANLAITALSHGIVINIENPEELIDKCFPTVRYRSDDSKIAARALIWESTLLPEEHNEVPGFRGPDEWFRNEHVD